MPSTRRTGTESARDASGNANTGTLINGPVWAVGKNGGALQFDGVNDRCGCNDANVLDLSTAATFEAWVYPTVAPSGWRTILQKEADAYIFAASTDASNTPASGGTFNGVCCTNVSCAGGAAGQHLDAPGGDLRRGADPLLRQRCAGGRRPRRPGPTSRTPIRCGSAATRCTGSTSRAARRPAHLQPRADRHRNPDRHEYAGRRQPANSPPGWSIPATRQAWSASL